MRVIHTFSLDPQGFSVRCNDGDKYFNPGTPDCTQLIYSGCPSGCSAACLSTTVCGAFCDPLNNPQFCRESVYKLYWKSKADYEASNLYKACYTSSGIDIRLKACRDAYRIMCCWNNNDLDLVDCAQALDQAEGSNFCNFCPKDLTPAQCMALNTKCWNPGGVTEPKEADYSLINTVACIDALVANVDVLAVYNDLTKRPVLDIFNCYGTAVTSAKYTGKDHFTIVFNQILPTTIDPACTGIIIGDDDKFSKGTPSCKLPDQYSIEVSTTSYTTDFPEKIKVNWKNYCTIPFSISVTLTDVPIVFSVTVSTVNNAINRCSGVEIKSVVLPAIKASVATYAWSAAYAEPGNVPSYFGKILYF